MHPPPTCICYLIPHFQFFGGEKGIIRLFSSSSLSSYLSPSYTVAVESHTYTQETSFPMNHLKNLRAGISRITQHVSAPVATQPEEEVDSDVEGDGGGDDDVESAPSTLPVAPQLPEEEDGDEEEEPEPEPEAEPPTQSTSSSSEVPQEEEHPKEDDVKGKGKEKDVKATKKQDPPPPSSKPKTPVHPKEGGAAPVRKQSGRKTLPPQRHRTLMHGPNPSKNTGILTMQGVRATKVYKPKILRDRDGKAISNTAAALTRSFVLTARHLTSQSDTFIIPKGPFVRLVREIADAVLSDPVASFKLTEVRFKSSALAALLVASENMLDLIFQQCGSAVITWFHKIQVDENVFRVSAMIKGPASVKEALDAMPVTLQAKVEADLYDNPERREKKRPKKPEQAQAETLAQRREKSAAERSKKTAPPKATPKKVVKKK
jgi:hypothetical protein